MVKTGIRNKRGLTLIISIVFSVIAFTNTLSYYSPEENLSRAYFTANNSLPGEYQYYDSINQVSYVIQFCEKTIRFSINLNNEYDTDPGFSFYVRMKYHIPNCRTVIIDDKSLRQLSNTLPKYQIVIDDYVSSNLSQNKIDNLVLKKNSTPFLCIGDTITLNKSLTKLQLDKKVFVQKRNKISASYFLESCDMCFSDLTRPRIAYYKNTFESQWIEVQNYWLKLSDDKWEEHLFIQNQGEDTCLLWFSPINIFKDLKMNILPTDIATTFARKHNAYFDIIFDSFIKGCSHYIDYKVVPEELCETIPIKVIYPSDSFEIVCISKRKTENSIIIPLLRLYDAKGLDILYECLFDESETIIDGTDNNSSSYYNIKTQFDNYYQFNILRVDVSDIQTE